MAINAIMVKMLQNKPFGAVGKPFLNVDYITASASATPNRWYPECKSRPLTVEEIHEMVDAFAKTAKLLQDAGVDGVEIHAVHEGYLLDQFTLANMNYRTDEYGGSFENRYRFAVEIVQAIKAVCGKDFPVALRYSVVSKTKGFGQGAVPGEEFTEFGRDMAESERAIKYLEDAGYDMFDCDNGTYDAWYWAHPPVYMPENCNLPEVEHIKNFTTKPVVCAGKMDPAKAAEEIAAGRLDAVGIARQNLVDPEWVNKILEDRVEDIKPCINCHNACFSFNKSEGTPNMQPMDDSLHLARCALTPSTMQHNKYKIVPTRKPKKVAIIGGGIAGLATGARHLRHGVCAGAEAAGPHPRHLREVRRAGRPVHHRLRHELQGGRQGPAALVRAGAEEERYRSPLPHGDQRSRHPAPGVRRDHRLHRLRPQDPAGEGLQQDHQLHPASAQSGGCRRPHRVLRRRPVLLRGGLRPDPPGQAPDHCRVRRRPGCCSGYLPCQHLLPA